MSDSLKLDQPAYGKEVAAAFGCGETSWAASRAAGYKYLYGTKTTLRHYMQWREANPDFRVTPYVKAHSKNGSSPVAGKGHSQRRGDRRGATVRNRDSR